MPTSPRPSTSNNWGLVDIFKKGFYTCRTWSLTKMGCQAYRWQEWQHTQERWVTTNSKCEWQHTQERWVTTHSKCEWQHSQEKVSTTAQKIIFKKITKDQVGRIERRKIELETKIWLIECINLLNYLSHFVYGK
jgi:hypothetical protein